MAAEAGVSQRGLHRHILNATGLSPGEWLVTERIARARDLLEETGLSVEQVACAVGFGSAAAFRERFRRVVGLTPRAYRVSFGTG